MNGLTASQRAMLQGIARDGERTVVVGAARPWWRTLDALIDKGLVRSAGSRVEAHGMVTRRVYVLTPAGERRAQLVSIVRPHDA